MNIKESIKELYKNKVIPVLKEEFSIKNDLAVPRILKVVINVGVGRQTKDSSYINSVANNLMLISGQKPVLTKAKKSISAFKVRQGNVVGVMVTLRGDRMYDFIDKLINITLPRVRDFRGLSQKSIDRSGNLSIGFKEHLPFPEIKSDDIEVIHGLEVSIVTSAGNRQKGLRLFQLLGFPFRSDDEEKIKNIRKK